MATEWNGEYVCTIYTARAHAHRADECFIHPTGSHSFKQPSLSQGLWDSPAFWRWNPRPGAAARSRRRCGHRQRLISTVSYHPERKTYDSLASPFATLRFQRFDRPRDFPPEMNANVSRMYAIFSNCFSSVSKACLKYANHLEYLNAINTPDTSHQHPSRVSIRAWKNFSQPCDYYT